MAPEGGGLVIVVIILENPYVLLRFSNEALQ